MPGDGKHRRSSRIASEAHLEEIRDEAANMGESLRAIAGSLAGASGELLDPVQDYVREKPLKSVMIALGAGALIGLLMFRRD